MTDVRRARFAAPAALAAEVGRELALGPWLALDQPRIDAFAEVSGDRQWIHVDLARARQASPFGSTIAHGFLVLSAASASMLDVVQVDGPGMAVIYGLERVRFIAPALAGARVRVRITLAEWQSRPEGGQARWAVVVEGEDMPKPVAVFELIVRYMTGPATPTPTPTP